MSKYDGEIRAVAEVSAELGDLLGRSGEQSRTSPARQDAMAHFLSGEEGWRDARRALRGTFATPSRKRAGLRQGSDK